MARCRSSKPAKGRCFQVRSATQGECSNTQPSVATKRSRERELISSMVIVNGMRRLVHVPSLLSAYAGNRQFGDGLADLHGSHRPKDPFWSGWTIKRNHASISKGGNGITQGRA